MSPGARYLRLALLGASAAALQTLFARELMAAFFGNEAVLAALLGPWFVLTALGAAAGREGAGPRWLAAALFALGPVAAATVAAARMLPRLFPVGSAPGAASALLWAAALLAPGCALSGLCFAWLAGEGRATGGPGAGRAWLAEAAGAAIAGAALSLALLGTVPTFGLVALLVAATTAAAALGQRAPVRALALATGLGIASALALLPLDEWTTRAQLPGVEVTARVESPLATIVVAGGSERTVFVDRRPLLTRRDDVAAEELVHLPLSLHPSPRRIAWVGVAPAGAMRAAAAHGVERVDQLFDDPELLDVVARELGDEGAPLARQAEDPRRWLAAHPSCCDVVILAAPEPTSAQLNRVFTLELFRTAALALREGGLLAVALPGYPELPSGETRRLHSSVRRTLEAALGPARVFPLDRTLYLAGRGPMPVARTPELVASALAARGVAPRHLTRALLERRLEPSRLADADRWSALPEPPNTDLRPTTYRLALDRALGEVGDLGVGALGLVALAIAVATALLFRPREQPVLFAVATTGASGLGTQLVLMLAYQIATGALFRELGLLLAGFMAGGAAGTLLALQGRTPGRWVRGADAAQLLVGAGLAAALPAVLALPPSGARVVAFVAAVVVGLPSGAQFAAAGCATGLRAGALYAADLAGAALAALATFTLAVPALGLQGALLAGAALKGLSSLALAFPAPAAERTRHPLAPMFPLGLLAMVLLAIPATSERVLSELTFQPAYQLLVLSTLLVATLAALEPRWLARRVVDLWRRLEAAWRLLALAPGRALHFVLLLPLAALPLGRCYFKVPFIFCHVCPRPCAFGALRAWVVGAAVLANLQGHRFCERLCPLGAAQAACEHVLGRRARRVAWLWVPRAFAAGLVGVAYFLARADHGPDLAGGPFFTAVFQNAYAPSSVVLGVALLLLAASLVIRRPFCEALCPVGAATQLADAVQRQVPAPARPPAEAPLPGAGVAAVPRLGGLDRRGFVRRAVVGCGAAVLGADVISDQVLRPTEPELALGFRNDAPVRLDRYSRPAAHFTARGNEVQCTLCPHLCVLRENDRGFCRTRVMKGGRLHTVGYGNLCAAHLDPIEKKPLFHYLPRTPILSVAIGGCNLRCLNCQNWEISQARPEEVAQVGLGPGELVASATRRRLRAIAYTYSEPLVAYEYVRDSAALARAEGIKNVLVTAGYVSEGPLRELCRVIDAVTLDVKAFGDAFYRRVSGGRLGPVLRTLEILREEKVWTEVSFLMVPTLSDGPEEIGRFAAWMVEHLGRGTPLHILRFHPAHRLTHLPWTDIAAMEQARARAVDAGLQFVYLGNVPGHDASHTRCPRDGRLLIEREGMAVKRVDLHDSRCPSCDAEISGVFEP